METERLLIDTEMPAGEIMWLRQAGIETMQQLSELSFEAVQALPGFRGEFLLTILLTGIDEGVSMMGLTLEEMARTAGDILGHPVTAKEGLRRLASFQERCIIFGYTSPLVA